MPIPCSPCSRLGCSIDTSGAEAQTAQHQVAVQAEEAQAMARQMVDVYAEFARSAAAMPVIAGAPLLL